jgi:hypothetical protein
MELRRSRELLAESAAVEAGLKAQIARLTSDVAGEQARGSADLSAMQAALVDLRASNAAKNKQIADLTARLGELGRAEQR